MSARDCTHLRTKYSLIGMSYGKLNILDIEYRGKRVYAECRCDCGAIKHIRLDGITSGAVVSCGCHKNNILVKHATKHGMGHTREYRIWQDIKQRCTNKASQNYSTYGAVGILCCDEWIESFANFYNDMGECPSGFSIDRIDVNLGYFKDNCRWASDGLQAFNKNKRVSKSGICGVSFDDNRNKWKAIIGFEGKNVFLGRFDSVDDAIQARLDAELKYYGEYKFK